MNQIRVVHLDRQGKDLDGSFIANLAVYRAANKNNGFDWDKAITCFYNGRSYTTMNNPYGNIRLEFINNK
jgi:hypothetical protein